MKPLIKPLLSVRSRTNFWVPLRTTPYLSYQLWKVNLMCSVSMTTFPHSNNWFNNCVPATNLWSKLDLIRVFSWSTPLQGLEYLDKSTQEKQREELKRPWKGKILEHKSIFSVNICSSKKENSYQVEWYDEKSKWVKELIRLINVTIKW